MILVIGGQGSGKRSFVLRELGYSSESLAEGRMDGRPVLCGLESMDPLPLLSDLLQKAVVVCDEVGCGLVPMDRSLRQRREEIGRLCCALAQGAEAVYRLQCGLPMRLK